MRHAFKNSLIQVVTVTGLQIGGLLSGSVMVETIFSISGLGRLLVDSINTRDYKVVQALLLFFSVEYIVVNLIVDLLYGVLLDCRDRIAAARNRSASPQMRGHYALLLRRVTHFLENK